jgi:hypothetical protein
MPPHSGGMTLVIITGSTRSRLPSLLNDLDTSVLLNPEYNR